MRRANINRCFWLRSSKVRFLSKIILSSGMWGCVDIWGFISKIWKDFSIYGEIWSHGRYVDQFIGKVWRCVNQGNKILPQDLQKWGQSGSGFDPCRPGRGGTVRVGCCIRHWRNNLQSPSILRRSGANGWSWLAWPKDIYRRTMSLRGPWRSPVGCGGDGRFHCEWMPGHLQLHGASGATLRW